MGNQYASQTQIQPDNAAIKKVVLEACILARFGSISEFAKKIHVSPAVVKNTISGILNLSDRDKRLWAEALEVEEAGLFGGNG